MATIIMNGQLRPSSGRATAHRAASPVRVPRRSESARQAARTREIQRVYRRRRIGLLVVVATVAVAGVLSVFSLFGASAAADGTAGQSVAPKYIVAQSGDTIWSIGERIAPNSPITEVVDELVRLNGTSLRVGQLVRIP
jgi:hypothetical protein